MELSISQKDSFLCPRCRKKFEVEIWLIIDTVNRPDLVKKIRDGILHDFTCPNCRFVATLDLPLLLYRSGKTPTLLFSPAESTTEEEDRKQAGTLIAMLRTRLGDAVQDSVLDELTIVPRNFLPTHIDLEEQDVEFFDLVSAWITGATLWDTRRFLETHLELLHPQTIAVLESLVPQLMGNPEGEEQIRTFQFIIQDAMQHGRSVEAVRQAYRNVFVKTSTQPGAPTSDDKAFAQLVMAWLCAGSTLRHTRRFLEAHPELLEPRTLAVLESLVPPPNVDPRAEEARHNLRDIIQDIVTHHGTVRDVAPAYVNVFGGLMLDLPLWLEAEIVDIAAMSRETPPDRSVAERWRTAWKQASQEGLAPEILAALAESIANALSAISDETLPQAQEDAIAWYERAQQVFTERRYPRMWAHEQFNLGLVYSQRMQGGQAENQEQAISYYDAAMRVYTQDRLPEEWARIQNNLGIIYADRRLGRSIDNQKLAIAHFTAALRVYTEKRQPKEWADTQVNLGNVYHGRVAGDRSENQERAITYYEDALRVCTEDRFPEGWARAQLGLGNVYQERKKGNPAENQERAIACYEAALRVYTQDRLPDKWALTQNSLGNLEQAAGNLEQAVAHYEAALPTLRATGQHHETELVLANLYNDLGRWQEAQAAYARLRQDNQRRLSLAETPLEQDPILRSETERVLGEAVALVRRGQRTEAALCVERGRARALAAARNQLAADPSRIRDPHLQQRYRHAREELQEAQAAFYDLPRMLSTPQQVEVIHGEVENPLPGIFGEVENPLPGIGRSPSPTLSADARQRTLWLQQKTAISAARQALDACLAEIASSPGLANFMHTEVPDTVFSEALACCPVDHALVYLLATYWGGLALIVCKADSASGSKPRVLAFDLPDLTWEMVEEGLIDRQIDVADYRGAIGGFYWGQTGSAFDNFRTPDDTFAERAASLHAACLAANKQGSFDAAAQAICALPTFAIANILNVPLNELARHKPDDLARIAVRFNRQVLRHEIRCGLTTLATAAMRPLTARLHEQGTMGVTLIPCSGLTTFPLLAAPVGPEQDDPLPARWQTFADAFSNGASIAPSAWALVRNKKTHRERKGLRAIGNPLPSHNPLPWGQAEALTLAELSDDIKAAHIQYDATKENVITDLKEALIYEASCHGNGGTGDFLDYGLSLANDEGLTLRDIFSGHLTDLLGLRLFILSSCQTGILDLSGARDEVRSLAVGLLQAGAEAVVATQWSVDDRATYLLIVRFYQIWQQAGSSVSPSASLAEAQRWLRTVTWGDLRSWWAIAPLPAAIADAPEPDPARQDEASFKYDAAWAQREIRAQAIWASENDQKKNVCPFADPFFWAGFSVTGW